MERPRKNITATIQPRKATDKGGWLCMPLADNIPNGKKGWSCMHTVRFKDGRRRIMNKRVREIVKMHLDTGLICKNTPISIIDLSAGKRVDVCASSRWITKYLEREVGAYKLSERNGLCIMAKSQEESEEENPYSKKRTQDPDELIPDLVEKAQMQQTLYDVLRMLDEWEYPSRYIDDAEENLRCATRELRDEIEKIQNVMAKEGNKRE